MESRVCMVESLEQCMRGSLCISCSSFTFKLQSAAERPGPSPGRPLWEKGLGMEAASGPAFPARLEVSGSPCGGPGRQAQLGGQRFSLGRVCRARTEARPAWEGAAAARCLFRHEFLSWHSRPQALHICLIPISLLSFKSTSLSGVITGQFSPHAKFRYCIYLLTCWLGWHCFPIPSEIGIRPPLCSSKTKALHQTAWDFFRTLWKWKLKSFED